MRFFRKEHAFSRLEEFSKLPEGWHFGEGDAVDEKSISLAKEIISFVEQFQPNLVVEVFPSICGYIRLCFYIGKEEKTNADLYWEFDLISEDQINYLKEDHNVEVAEMENINKQKVFDILQNEYIF